jgi:molybdopterin/thiamine biosynthesis adenylyltransferase
MYAAVATTEDIFSELTRRLDEEPETAAMCQAGIAMSENAATLLIRDVDWVPERHYEERTPLRLKIRSQGFVPGFTKAVRDMTVPVFFHTHPGGGPGPSLNDDAVEAEMRRLALIRTGRPLFGALILGGSRTSPTFSARLYLGPTVPAIAAEKLRVVGRQLRIIPSTTARYSFDPVIFDRQVRALGADGQRTLRALRVGVVGSGGTGSPTFEQVVRLGVGHVTLIDDDVMTKTNVTRIHGSSVHDAGAKKVTVLAREGNRIDLGARTVPIDGKVTVRSVAQALRYCDIVFGCTDDHWGRAILSKLAYYYLVPVIDMGVIVDTDEQERIREVMCRITTVMPGTACLMCRNEVNPHAIRWEQLGSEERQKLVAEGYVPPLGDPDPSVVSYTTLTSGFAVSELLDRLFVLGEVKVSSELRLRVLARATSRNSQVPEASHYCGDQWFWGLGDTVDFLDMTWPG